MLKKSTILLFTVFVGISAVLYASCDSPERIESAPVDNIAEARMIVAPILRDSTLHPDSLSQLESFKQASKTALTENKRRIDDLKMSISIGIGPVHDSQWKKISTIEYKNGELKKSLTGFMEMKNTNPEAFRLRFKAGMMEITKALDSLIIE